MLEKRSKKQEISVETSTMYLLTYSPFIHKVYRIVVLWWIKYQTILWKKNGG